jgi:hypothetical protein
VCSKAVRRRRDSHKSCAPNLPPQLCFSCASTGRGYRRSAPRSEQQTHVAWQPHSPPIAPASCAAGPELPHQSRHLRSSSGLRRPRVQSHVHGHG